MKNYFYKLLFACFLTATSYSQQVNNTEFKTKTLQVFQNLDKSRVPHGILLDFGMEFTNLKAFNGTLTDSTFTTSQTMSDIYKTLLMCRVRSNVTTGFITPQEYAIRWYTQRTNGVMILSGQYFKYNNFADNAYPSKLNYSNNQFSDKFVGSTWQNPYEERQLFAMSPAISTYKGLKLKLKLPSNLFLSNYPATIQTIQIDFSNGLGYRTITYNQLLSVNYTQPNTYIWKYKITLTNGQVLHSHSKVVIENGLNATEIQTPTGTGATLLSSQSTMSTQAIALPPDPALAGYSKRTIVSTTQYLGYNASATIYIRYAPGGNTIRKPLIVAEGFDDGIILKPEQEAGSNNINDFLDDVDDSNSNALESEIDTYDIIYVDWNNGVTFLQRNAYVLQEVIKWVNNNKTTTTQNVVLGQSMGGLIARYALKDMENRGLPHDTRLYVSHDAPHLGANTPVSMQLALRHVRNMYVNAPILLAAGEIIIPMIYNFAEGFSDIINGLGGSTSVPANITPLRAFSKSDAPATRQMSYNWVNTNYGINNLIHDAWQNDLSNMGYPNQTRNIAIANGSECGVTQTDNGNIYSYYSEKKFDGDKIRWIDSVIGVLINDPGVAVVGLLPGSSSWKSDFQVKYMTNLNQNKNIYKGFVGYKKKFLWFIPISITITDVNINQPTGILPFDIYGGGFYQANADQLPLADIVNNGFGFIPTASSLDVGKWTTPLNDADYRRFYAGGQPLVAPKNSPFQNFVTGFVENNPTASNSRHISFNTRNGNWLATELDVATADEVTDCSFICANNLITGSNTLCISNNYSGPTNNNTTYNWTILQGANLATLSNANNQIATLTKIGYESGRIVLALNLSNNSCGSTIVTKTIWAGRPTFPISSYVSGASNVNFNQTRTYTYNGTGADGADTGIQWYIDAPINDNGGPNCGWSILSGQGTSSITVRTGCISAVAVVSVRAGNSCGFDSRYMYVSNTATGTGDPCATTLTTNPNPITSNNNLEINLTTPVPCDTFNNSINLINQNNLTQTSKEVKIYDLSGVMVYSNNFNSNSITLNNLNLNPGNYILNVFSDGKSLRKILVVQ